MPCDTQAAEIVRTWPAGQGVRAKVTRVRSLPFHRRFFAMLDVAFDAWEPENAAYAGKVAIKSKERFRKDLLVLAGYYQTTVNLKGEVRLEAESMNFASMDEDRFHDVYNRVVDVVLTKILTNYARDDLDNVVDRMMGFL